jgi:site-specific DNA-cytosine methylase
MRKAGQGDDCAACSSALAAADALSAADVDKLPLPGEVDLIIGGPPCQVRQRSGKFQGSAVAESTLI